MSISRIVVGAAATAALAAILSPPALAAETVGSDGWICTTDPVPTVPATGAERARIHALQPTVTFSSASHMTVRFAAPVARGARLSRSGGNSTSIGTTSRCPAIGYVDRATTQGQRYRLRISALNRATSVLEVGDRLPAPTSLGRLVIAVDQRVAADIAWALDDHYIPAITEQGWRVVKEVVAPGTTPAQLRARLRARVQEDASTNSALLLGELPVAYSGADQGAGARPTDVYYADVDGTWTDTSVNLPAPADAARRNVPGDGRFDQEAAPSAIELAVGRVDMGRLDQVRRMGSQFHDPITELQSYLLRSADQRISDNGVVRPEGFVIDDGDPASTAGTAGWNAASAIGPVTAGTRADLDAANGAQGGWYATRPALLFQHGRSTGTTLLPWSGGAEIAGLADAGHGRVVISAGQGLRLWDRPDSLVRAQLTSWTGADASAADYLDMDGQALGETLGASFARGVREADRRGDRLGSLMGDPTLPAQPTGDFGNAKATIAPGCEDVNLSMTFYGTAPTATPTATVLRSVNGGAPQAIGQVTLTWDADQGEFRGAYIDRGVVTAQADANVTYEMRIVTKHTSSRGSFLVNGPTGSLPVLQMRCAWECETPTAALPTDPVERSRSDQLESRVRFAADGRSARIVLDRRHAGRTISGRRTDTNGVASTEVCASGLVASAFRAEGLEPGKISEFELSGSGGGMRVPVLAGHDLAPQYDRGRVIVVHERTLTTTSIVRPAYQQWLDALEGDGYEIATLPVDRTDSVASVRSRLKALYDQAPAKTKTAVILGDVPVPYSGTGVWDGHPEHNGGWSTDAPYADLDGAWTDTTVNITNSARTQNRNVPGDGKFDQNVMPSTAELAVGRIDFSDMPALGTTEAQLTADYLRRSIQYRQGLLPYRNEAFTRDNFGFVRAGWLANVTPVVGAAAVRPNRSVADARTDTATGGPYLLAYAAGGGSYSTSSGVGTVTNPVPALFMGSLGSYYGDWDSRDNFLRGHLAKNLGALWENWAVDGLALGESFGDTARRNLDRRRSDLRFKLNSYLGDPTLRAYPLRGVTNLGAWDEDGCQWSSLSWSPSADPTIAGYVVERRYDDGWRVLTTTPLPRTATNYEDRTERGFYSGSWYRVRPIRREETTRGSFTNVGQGSLAYAGSCD